MKVVVAHPPNYKEIVARFPAARGKSVIFAYGELIYAPGGGKGIDMHLHAHEYVHSCRQLQIGVKTWWERYLDDAEFRYNEELLAHRAEFFSMIASGYPHKSALKLVAGRLSGKLYSAGRTFKQVSADILERND